VNISGAQNNQAVKLGYSCNCHSSKTAPTWEGFRMARIMPVEKRNAILRLLVEGNSIRSVTRLMGTNIPTVLRQLTWAGQHCQQLMDERFRNLNLNHLECDETWTFVKKKQGRLTVEEKRTRSDIGDVYLWIALDQGRRNDDNQCFSLTWSDEEAGTRVANPHPLKSQVPVKKQVALQKVEAAGIEPASRDISTQASTCVVDRFDFA